MNWQVVVEEWLVWVAFVLLATAVVFRLGVFIVCTLVNMKSPRVIYLMNTFTRSLVPLHMLLVKRPLYSALRYIFHIFLFVVPIWYSAHVDLWSDSRFAWYWDPLPDVWADRLTIVILLFLAFFLVRRAIFSGLRRRFFWKEYALIILTALPYLSGYFVSHGTLDSIPFFRENLYTFHILTGEIMLCMMAFLFIRVCLDQAKCTACAACATNCPTGALEFRDDGAERVIGYSHCQCICCATCVLVCPEGAAELRHDISIRRLFQLVSREKVRVADLALCERCHRPFIPVPQMHKLDLKVTGGYVRLCQRCKQHVEVEKRARLTPWMKKIVSSKVRA